MIEQGTTAPDFTLPDQEGWRMLEINLPELKVWGGAAWRTVPASGTLLRRRSAVLRG